VSDDGVLRPGRADELRASFVRLRSAGLSARWRSGSSYREQARSLLAGTFTDRAVCAALDGLALSLTRPVLTAALACELGRLDLLESWQPDATGAGLVRAYPLGVVAQVLAGNVFLGGVIALAQALLTRNAVLLKLSREDTGFTTLFVRSLREADEDGLVSSAVTVCSWDSRQEEFNEVVRSEADGVVVWGGASAVAAYPAERCRGPVSHYGPRFGIGLVLAGADLDRSLPALAWDVALWEQQACSSPRLLLVEDPDGSGSWPRTVAAGLDGALGEVRRDLPPRRLTLDEKTEILSLRELAWWSNEAEILTTTTMDHSVLLQRQPPQNVPIGFRTVLVTALPGLERLSEVLAPYRAGLQTAVLAAPAARWPGAADALARAGITQITAAGAAAARFLGLPHEGDFALRRLVRLVGIDLGVGPLVYPNRTAEVVPELAQVMASKG
jgi:phenylacetate-CoA ligase